MARSKKILTEYDRECQKRMAEHVQTLIKKKSATIKQLADDLGVAESTLRNYAKGRTVMRPSIAQVFADKNGSIPAYWLGKTSCETWEDYRKEQAALEISADMERAIDAGEDAYYTELKRREKELSQLFSKLGFSCKDTSGSAAYDFQDIAANAAHNAPYIITSLSAPELSASFTEEELQGIFERMRNVIDLELFKTAKKDALFI